MHFSISSLKEIKPYDFEDIDSVLKNLGDMKLWRCTVCNDLHIGVDFPKECPTCKTMNAYVEIDEKEFRGILGAFNG